MAAPSSAAQERLGRTRNNASAIITIRITSFDIFMIAFSFQNLKLSRRCVRAEAGESRGRVSRLDKNLLIVMQFPRRRGIGSVIVVTDRRDCGGSLSRGGTDRSCEKTRGPRHMPHC